MMSEMCLYEEYQSLATPLRESEQSSDVNKVGNRSEILTAGMCLVPLNNLKSKQGTPWRGKLPGLCVGWHYMPIILHSESKDVAGMNIRDCVCPSSPALSTAGSSLMLHTQAGAQLTVLTSESLRELWLLSLGKALGWPSST